MAKRKQGYSLRDIVIRYNDTIIGGAQSLNVELAQENSVYGEAGTNKPIFILPGEMRYTGSIEKVEFDFTFAKDVIDFEEGNNPYFTLTGINKVTGETVTVVDAVFKGWKWNPQMSEATKTDYPFDALDVKLK